MASDQPSNLLVPFQKKDRAFLGYAVQNGHIRFTSPKQILEADDHQDGGCMRKFTYTKVFRRKLARTGSLVEGDKLAQILEHYLKTGEAVLPPVLAPVARFFPVPGPDLLCEVPFGDVAAAVALRDLLLKSPNAKNRAAVEAEIERLAGISVLGIPVDGAADCVHRRNTYKDKSGALVEEARGHVVAGVLDLKSTTQINPRTTRSGVLPGWAQTDAEVVADAQVVAYEKRYLNLWKDATHARGEKVYAQKKSPYCADIRGGLSSRQQVEDRWGEIGDRVVSEMVQVAGATKIEDVRPNTSACDAYTHLVPCGYTGCGDGCFPGRVRRNSVEVECPACKGKGRTERGCGFRYECPRSPASVQIPIAALERFIPASGETSMPSLFDRLRESPPPSPPPQSEVVPAGTPALDDASYQAKVEQERRKLEAELAGTSVDDDVPVPPPGARQTEMPLPVTIGERISVALCVQGEEYMVDCGDGHPPYRMKFTEVRAGEFIFFDVRDPRVKTTLSVTEMVWRLPPGTPAAAAPSEPAKPLPCGAPGCGAGCAPGYVRVESGGYVTCKACGGKGAVPAASMAVKPPDAPKVAWLDQQAPLSAEEVARITDPKLKELAVEHKRVHEEQERLRAAAEPDKGTRGGNCVGSGVTVFFAQQPTAISGTLVCSVCGVEKAIPNLREFRKMRPPPESMPFPGHRRPKAGAVVPAQGSEVPVPPSSVVETVPVPPQSAFATQSSDVPVPPTQVPNISERLVGSSEGMVHLSATEVDQVSSLFRGRCLVPVQLLSAEVADLLRRLRLVD